MEEKVKLIQLPHLIILGAGASIATTLYTGYTGNRLPLMRELPEVLKLKEVLGDDSYKRAEADYELFFTELVNEGKKELISEMERRTWEYFSSIQLQDTVTLYDKLVLSLRPKDTIISFNWDPLLCYAYRRHGFLKSLPALWFLHGNVLSGYCKEHSRIGWTDDVCDICKNPLDPIDLLQPTANKNYEKNPIISESWRHFDDELSNFYFLTIFGYSSPKSDIAARERMMGMIENNRRKDIAQFEVIDINAESLIREPYKEIYEKRHVSVFSSIDSSWIFQYPKLSCEALYYATMMQHPIKPKSLPQTESIHELQEWAKRFDEEHPEVFEEKRKWQG